MTLMADLMLLAVDPEQHRIRAAQKIGYALRGAELVELAIAERVGVTDGRIHVLDPAPFGDARLDAALASLVAAQKPPRAKYWVQRESDTARRAQIAVLV